MKTFLFFLSVLFSVTLQAQITKMLGGDTTNLPRIKITADPSSFGPYYINSKHTNVYFVTDFPENTTKVVMKYIDSKGKLLGEPKIKEGSNIEVVEWTVEAQDVGLVLSSQLCIEVYYETDSLAVYKIPYTVYPDTVLFDASAGWGPFISNRYLLNDGYDPVEPVINTITAGNLPPRTDTVEFLILNNDSTVIDSLWVFAPVGQYLDSAVFSDVRMDSMPLSTRLLQTRVWCEGGPDDGLLYNKELNIVQQEASITTITDEGVFVDSIPVFEINQYIGQAVLIDSIKSLEITNGPADTYNSENYTGPYCFNMFGDFSDFSIEAWLRFDLERIHNASGYGEGMNIMMVDSVWGLDMITYGSHFHITLRSHYVEDNNAIFNVDIPFDEIGTNEWHHIALTYNCNENTLPEVHMYLDSKECENSTFHQENYYEIKNLSPWLVMKTQPLIIGHAHGFPDGGSFITGADEIRLWHKVLSAEEIRQNFHKKVLQSPELVGYWNFDDLRNRMGYASDISYNNNRGLLKNGATFISQHPSIQLTLDTLIFKSSNKNADSVNYSFRDKHNLTVKSITHIVQGGYDTLVFDFSSLPEKIAKLMMTEYSDETLDKHDSVIYYLEAVPPIPIATPRYNWKAFYSDEGPDMAELFNSIVVSGLPENATRVNLQLKNVSRTVLSEDYYESSIPYRYSLTLNGIDNYVENLLAVKAPENYTLSVWFKTTSTEGGEIIGFKEAGNLFDRSEHDRKLVIRKDGSLRYYMISDNAVTILSAVNRYNDGRWHQVTVSVGNGAKLYVDGSIVDVDESAVSSEKSGFWVMGLGDDAKRYRTEKERINKYFRGAICEVVITENSSDYHWVNTNLYGLKDKKGVKYHYKFDDGKGDVVQDYASGLNALIKGSGFTWFTSNKVSHVVWNHDVLNRPQGSYDFMATVYYPGAPDSGVVYQLGKIQITKPVDFLDFRYQFKNGFGYFNEGTAMPNSFDFTIKNATEEHAVYCKLFTLEHLLIAHKEFVFGSGNAAGSMAFDVGDVPPGSFISVAIKGTSDGGQFTVPLFVNPLIKPVVTCDLGPFAQAIAPNTMAQINKISVTTEILSDLKRIKAVFSDNSDNVIDTLDLTQENDTTWSFSYDMATLSPPVTRLNLYYYLGDDPYPALAQGPYPITILKTRPPWFDFVPDKNFHDVVQNGNIVNFKVKTPLSHKSNLKPVHGGSLNMSVFLLIPDQWKLLGGAISGLDANIVDASLKFNIKEFKLELNQKPNFYQNSFFLGVGNSKYFEFNFETTQDDSYEIDEHNNLVVSQNFDMQVGGNHFIVDNDPVKKVKELLTGVESLVPGSEIIKPSFSIRAYGGIKYSSRLHMKPADIKNGWGSYGNLDIEADPDKPGFKESASFYFIALALGIEFDVGAELAEGLISGNFGTSVQGGIGFGESYVDIPYNKKRILKSMEVQIYGRFFVDFAHGWYSTTIWGPKLFCSYTIWGDDLSQCFPEGAKKSETFVSNSSWPELTDEIIPVHSFNKVPMPVATPRISFGKNQNIFSWIEPGSTYGDRKLMARYYDKNKRTFSDKFVVELNNNALNRPVAEGVQNNLSFYTWAQSRYNSTTIQAISPEDVLSEFARSEDIWYAVYDHEKDSLLIKEPFTDDSKSITSGRPEANPVMSALSDERVIIVWQVADLDNHTSAIWYNLIEKTGGQWKAGIPQVLTGIDGVATNLEIASCSDGEAVVTWLETEKGSCENKIMTVRYDGENWTEAGTLADEQNRFYNYLSLNFNSGYGGLVYTRFTMDSVNNPYEELMLLPWDCEGGRWKSDPVVLMNDTVNHLQLPAMAIYDDGTAAIAVKVEELVEKTADRRVSQIDLFMGNLNNPLAGWNRIDANQYVCDTTKQVRDFSITWAGKDTLMLLSNEYPMLPTNSAFTPVNGVIFGDPYMNLVFRSFKLDESGIIQDIDEHKFFTGIPEVKQTETRLRLYQNYPNPCNESTTITFDINKPGKAVLELYDVTGNRIAVLADRNFNIGRFDVKLNTLLLNPGTYIYRLTAGNQSSSLRLVVNH